MKLTFFYVLKTVMQSAVLSAAILFVVSPASCSLSKDGIRLLACETVPELLSFSADSPKEISFRFDRNVHFENLRVYESDNDECLLDYDCDATKMETEKILTLANPAVIGKSYTVDGVVGDENGNSLLFSVGFKGFNDNLAQMFIAEVRNAYSSKTNQYEYVKFYCSKGGNLSGYEFFTAGDGLQKKFEFPEITVKAGDYVTVHLRKMKDDGGEYRQKGMIDEIYGDKTASYAVDSSRDSWDFWIENQKSRISPSDIIVLRNSANGEVCDVLLLADVNNNGKWNAKFDDVCQMVESSSLWLDESGSASSDISSAVACTGITSSAVSRTICRKRFNQPSCADDWYIKTKRKSKAR